MLAGPQDTMLSTANEPDVDGIVTAGHGSTSEVRSADERQVRALVFPGSSFPSEVMPVHGVFVKERVRNVAALPNVDVRVLAPVPYFPPIRQFSRWYPWSQVPRRDSMDGLQIDRPRYLLIPKIGGNLTTRLMYPVALRAARRLQRSFDFDVIDAHFAYPNGVVAAQLGEKLGKPVVITGRGEDMERFPDLPHIGKLIRSAVQGAAGLIAVSERIAERMEQLGADPHRITVIPNGVDCDKFRPLPKTDARQTLGLDQERPIILAVGYRLELKGFHLLVDAIPRIREQFPDVLVAIVGGQARWAADFLPTIEEHIQRNGVAEHVMLTGARPPEELYQWYSAADVLSILSSREGSPNVLMEALACGLPAVATPVGGIPSVLADPRLGTLLPERSAEAAAHAQIDALSRDWDRDGIRRIAENWSWGETARQVEGVFRRVTDEWKRDRERQPGERAGLLS